MKDREPTFEDVKDILDSLVSDYDPGRVARRHRNSGAGDPDPNLFGWETEQQLLNAKARGYYLINPEYRGNGEGHRTNLVIALTDPDGVDGNGRMPIDGPFVDIDSEEIQTIIAWINGLRLA